MAQTPISASVNFSGTTPVTIYTVPTGKTAVVNSVIPTSVVGSAATVTLNKVSSGTVYPLALSVQTSYPVASGSNYYLNPVPTVNLLPGPITLTAGESISLSTSTSTYFKDPLGVSNSALKLTNGNYVNGNYVVLGQDTSTGYGLVLTSTDGLTWTQRTFNFYVVTQDITYGNGYYVICNQATAGKIHYSTDLATWTEVSLPAGAAMYSITFGGNKFLVGGSGGNAFYSTSTPLSWTQVVFPNGNYTGTINSVSYIGTNYVFATSGPTFTTTDFSTYVSVNYMYDSTGWAGCTANATRFYSTTYTAPVSVANRVVQYTTDGITFTNGTTVTFNGGDSQTYPIALGNGAMLLMPQYWYGTSLKYTRSSDGLTWTNITGLNITNYTTAGTSYTQAVYPVIDSTRNFIGTALNATKIQFNLVAADGAITASSSINFNANNLSGNFSFAGNPTTGTWIAGCGGYYSVDTSFTGWYHGTGPTVGSDATGNFTAVYRPSYGSISTCHYRPGTNGFMIGMQNGYVGTTTSQSTGMSNIQRPTSNGSNVACFACDGNTATSAIAYIQTDGFGAVSRDQGNTWTTMRVPGDSFGTQEGYASKCLQYVNGLWIAQNTSGQTFVSTNALVWTTAPIEVTNMATLNSNNVFLSSKGVFASSGSSVTSFTRSSTTVYTNYPSNRNMIYANSKYLLGYGGSVNQSTDLATWTSASVSNTTINDVQYWSTNNGTALLADGSGNFLAVGSKRDSPSSEGKIGKTTTVNAALVVGNVTAGIVEIS